MTIPMTGQAAGVPFLALPPSGGPRPDAPVVLAWHLMDPPRTEAAFAAALPLAGLDAWRIYLGLPMTGSRTPPGGDEEVMRLGYEDAVLNLFGPISDQAVAEVAPAYDELRRELDLGSGPVGVLGGSHGAAVAQLVIAEGTVDVSAAVLVSPVVRLRSIVEANARNYDMTYTWSEPSLAVAGRMDFVARADEVSWPATLLVIGADDDASGVREPAEQLHAALADRSASQERAELIVIDGMGHALADEPGTEPAPQTAHAAEVDEHAVRWLRRHLVEAGRR